MFNFTRGISFRHWVLFFVRSLPLGAPREWKYQTRIQKNPISSTKSEEFKDSTDSKSYTERKELCAVSMNWRCFCLILRNILSSFVDTSPSSGHTHVWSNGLVDSPQLAVPSEGSSAFNEYLSIVWWRFWRSDENTIARYRDGGVCVRAFVWVGNSRTLERGKGRKFMRMKS